MKEKKVMKLASRGKRLGAFCIDAAVPLICLITYLIVGTVLSVYASRSMMNGFGEDPFGFGYGYGYGYGYGLDRPNTGGLTAAVVIATLLMLIYTIVQIVFYTKSKTIGKAALGLEVVSSDNGRPIGFWKMLFREWFVKQASGVIFALGYIWVLIDDKNRGWHDKILDTYVVDLKETERLYEQAKRKARAEAARKRREEAKAAAAAPAETDSVREVLREPEEVRHLELDEVNVVTKDTAGADETIVSVAEEAEATVDVISDDAEVDTEVAAAADAEPEAETEKIEQEGE